MAGIVGSLTSVLQEKGKIPGGILITSAAVQRKCSIDLDEHSAILDTNLVRSHIFKRWRRRHLAGAKIECSVVKRADDIVTIEMPFTERRLGVGAHLINGKDFIAAAKEGDLSPPDVDGKTASISEIVQRDKIEELTH
jgi:hypothetical protein